MTPVILGLGALIMALSLFIAGITGFGNGLVSLPLLLLLGVPLEQIVVVNLVIIIVTRIATTWQLRSEVDWRKTGLLAAGTVVGTAAGVATFERLSLSGLRIFAGIVIIAAAGYLAARSWRTDLGRRREPGAATWQLTGVLGGFFGLTTSLNGLPVAIVSARYRVFPMRFVADISAYFVVSGLLILGGMWLATDVNWARSLKLSAWWLPGALLANWLGLALLPRINRVVFERVVLMLIAATGVMTLVV